MYNMSVLDGILRIILGSIIGGVFAALGVLWLAFPAPILIVTGLGGYCPLYHALGWSTLEDPETNSHHNAPAVESKTIQMGRQGTKNAA